MLKENRKMANASDFLIFIFTCTILEPLCTSSTVYDSRLPFSRLLVTLDSRRGLYISGVMHICPQLQGGNTLLNLILHTPYSLSHTLYPPLCTHTVYPTLCTPYCLSHTVYPTLCTLYGVPHTVYPMLCTPHCVPYTVYPILCTPHYVPIQFIPYCVHHTVYPILCTPHCLSHTVYPILFIPYCVPHNMYPTRVWTAPGPLLLGFDFVAVAPVHYKS